MIYKYRGFARIVGQFHELSLKTLLEKRSINFLNSYLYLTLELTIFLPLTRISSHFHLVGSYLGKYLAL